MEFRYEAERIYLTDDHGRMAAEITFHQRSDQGYVHRSHLCLPELQGRGVAATWSKPSRGPFRARGLKARSRVFLRGEWFAQHRRNRTCSKTWSV